MGTRAPLRGVHKEKIMTQQDRQLKKVKLYRTLKVVFYCLGLPLFVVAVFLASVRFIGNDPFTGNSVLASKLGFFKEINVLFTSPALYGVWIALGIWLFIAVVHIILAKTVKSRRVRTLAVTALTMAVMLGGMFGMDAVLGAKIDEIAENAPSTVTVEDYKTQLSYYRAVSSAKQLGSYTTTLIDQVKMLEKVYNVAMEGENKTGTAGSIANKPVTYYNVISDEGVTGVDISFTTDASTGFAGLACDESGGNNVMTGDGQITKDVEGKRVIRLKPNADGRLVINGTIYSHYFAVGRGSVTGDVAYTWYTKDMESTAWRENEPNSQIDNLGSGVYGKALYNQNGLLSDGWVFSFENVLEILEDYYESKQAIENGEDEYYANAYAQMYADAWQRRDDYYNGRTPDKDGNYCDKWLTALYNQEVEMTSRFSLTRGELDELVAKVGALLGDNSLFGYLFSGQDGLLGSLDDAVSGFLGGSLNNLFKQLNQGLGLSGFGLDAGTLNTITDILQTLTGKTYDYVDDLYIVLAYKGATDCFGVTHDNLYLAVVRGIAEWQFADGGLVPVSRNEQGEWVYDDGSAFVTTANGDSKIDKDGKEVKYVVNIGKNADADIMLDIDFDDRVIGSENIFDEINGTDTYAFDLDTLSAFLNTGLNNLIEKYVGGLDSGAVGTILNLVKSLNILKTIDVDGETYTGLVISGIEIPIIDSHNKINLDINGILTNLVSTLYSYQSAVIKPVWEFYVNPAYDLPEYQDFPPLVAARDYAKYERALYTATIHGKMIGSTLLGDSLGTGTYPSSLGLNDLASVQQLKTNLSYQPVYFPLYALRDMLSFLTGLVVLFYFISFVAAQKEEDYATGKLTVRAKKEKKAHEAKVIAEFDSLDLENADENNIDNSINGADAADDNSVDSEDGKGKSGKKRLGKKGKADKAEEAVSEEELDFDFLDLDAEEKPKKKRFGKRNKKGGEDPDLPVNENTDGEVL